MKRLVGILLALAVICSLAVCVSAADKDRVIDESFLLTMQEEEKLEELFSQIYNDHGIDTVVLTVDSLGDYDAQYYADSYYDSNGYVDDGALLLLCMDERIWWVSTCGSCISAVDPDRIGDEIVSDLSSGYYYDAFYRYGVLCADAVSGGYADDPYEGNAKSLNVPKTIFTSLLIGGVVALVVVLIMSANMKSVRKQYGASSYICHGSLQLRQSSDIYLYQHTTRTAKPKNNSSGGGGGRSHGGGGGRF